MSKNRGGVWKCLAFLMIAALLVAVGVETFNLAWGSGFFLGRISLKWFLALLAYLLAALFILLQAYRQLLRPELLELVKADLIELRTRLGTLRWLLATLVFVLPGWLVFYSAWGLLFSGAFTRLLIFLAAWLLSAYLVSNNQGGLFGPRSALAAGLMLSVALVLAEAFVFVSDYPFAQYWSEGNRIWDYSIRFGSERYNVPAGETIFAFIDPGRQTLWGLPFLLPNVSIWGVRLWSALVVTIPYMLLGWLAFRPIRGPRLPWFLAGLWTLVFLHQGPIYTPLVLSAALVAAAWRRPIWLAVPLVLVAGHYAGLSRFSWSFAPGLWVLMLTLGDAVQQQDRLLWHDWLRAGLLGLAGIWSKGWPILVGVVQDAAARWLAPAAEAAADAPATGGIGSLEGLQSAVTNQPLLWERLLPNAAFPPGILLGLLIATLPLILLLVYLLRRGIWKTNLWSRLVTLAAMLALLAVGLIASVKVGGGLDLHNLDMFLVGLVLLAGLAWESGWHEHLLGLLHSSPYVRGLLLAMALLPGLWPMFSGAPQVLPDEERTAYVLAQVQEAVPCAADNGELLFMDERQLLTFGEVENVPLVDEYEKKYVMDQALAGNAEYFEQFSADLASGRFALIVSESQPTVIKLGTDDQGDSLVEENNAWALWVTQRLLADYESIANYEDVGVELFVPIGAEYSCP